MTNANKKWAVVAGVLALVVIGGGSYFINKRGPQGGANDIGMEEPILVAYPETSFGDITNLLLPEFLQCKITPCGGKVQVLNESGKIHEFSIDGMLDPSISFSPDKKSIIFTDSKYNHIIHNGTYSKDQLFKPVDHTLYSSIENNGDYLDIGFGSSDPATGKQFVNTISRKSGNTTQDDKELYGSVFSCQDDVYLFYEPLDDTASGEAEWGDVYVLNRENNSFELIKHPDKSDITVLNGYACMDDGSLKFVGKAIDNSNNLVVGSYSKDTGFKIEDGIYKYDKYVATQPNDPIVIDSDRIWFLDSSGKMLVFDLKSKSLDIAWDASKYFVINEYDSIEAKYVYSEDAVFFFGRPKGINHWVMIELDRITGKAHRAVRVPFLDKKATSGGIEEIAIGDVDKFRAWADTQPKFDLSTIGK